MSDLVVAGGGGIDNMHEDWEPTVRRIEERIAEIRSGLDAFANYVGEQTPTHAAIAEAYRQAARHQAQVLQSLVDARSLYRKVHAADIARGENPRPFEHLWNVRR